MHRTRRKRARYAPPVLPLAVKGLLLLFVLCLIFRLMAAVGVEEAVEELAGRSLSENALGKNLGFEAGRPARSFTGDIAAVVFGGTLQEVKGDTPPEESPPPSASPSVQIPPPYYTGLIPYYPAPSPTPEPLELPEVVLQEPAKTETALAINNRTSKTVDPEKILKKPLNLTIDKEKPSVLIIHTHGSEAYMPDEKNRYVPSDPYRTQDTRYSVIRIGEEIARALEEAGIACVHDKGIYDYPSYQGAYNRSYEAISKHLKEYPTIRVVLDVHRDALEDSDGTVYKTIAQVGDVTCAQVMMVVGTNDSGLNHPNWERNLRFALALQQKMQELYPTLAKPIELSRFRYNQQATPGSLIVEIGCTGNTLEEALQAARYFADAAAKVLGELKEAS